MLVLHAFLEQPCFNSCLSCSQWLALVSELIAMLDEHKGHIKQLPIFPVGLDNASEDAIKSFADDLLAVFPLETSTYDRPGPLLHLRCMISHVCGLVVICVKLGSGMCYVTRDSQIWH